MKEDLNFSTLWSKAVIFKINVQLAGQVVVRLQEPW